MQTSPFAQALLLFHPALRSFCARYMHALMNIEAVAHSLHVKSFLGIDDQLSGMPQGYTDIDWVRRTGTRTGHSGSGHRGWRCNIL